jgi:hypothetical protein
MLQSYEANPGELPVAENAPNPAAAAPPDTFQFLERLNSGRHPCMGELWKIRRPDSTEHWLRLVGGLEDEAGMRQAAEVLKQPSHPTLMPTEVAEHDCGRLRIITELPEATLCDRLQQCRDCGQPGIPRQEMVQYLTVIADALDKLYDTSGMQHLAVTPRNLVIHQGNPRIADFGVAQVFAVWRGFYAEHFNAAYSAPELFTGKPSRSSDQYSVALIYVEMLTGVHPIRVQVRNRAAVGRGQYQPDLNLVPALDRRALGRALSADPRRRFSTLTEFVHELARVQHEPSPANGGSLPKVIRVTDRVKPVTEATPDLPKAELVLDSLVKQATRSIKIRRFQGFRYLLAPAKSLLHHCLVPALPGMVEISLNPFCTEWNAKVLESNKDHFVVWVPGSLSLVGALLASRAGLKITIRLRFERSGRGGTTPASILIEPTHAGSAQADTILEDLAPRVLAGLRQALRALPDRRQNVRYPFSGTIYVCPVERDQKLGQLVKADAFDLTEEGIGFWLREQPRTHHVYLYSDATPETSAFALLATIVRVQPDGNGQFEVGAKFCLSEAEESPTV